MKFLVTGAAGFIGFHIAHRLLAQGHSVCGIDNLNDYYAVSLKQARLAILTAGNNFTFFQDDIADRPAMEKIFASVQPEKVIHLAAQAGVRYSITHPHAYAESNLLGFVNILEGCRKHKVQHLVYASSSSVYGANATTPFSVHDNVDHPVSLYAATKKANELMAHTYSHLYGLSTTGLRFFTVYGPWGRPDMAMFIFTRAILSGEPLPIFNHGRMQRDFTFIDDITEGVVRVAQHNAAGNPGWNSAQPDPGTSRAPYRIYNIGNSSPVELLSVVQILERCLGRKANLQLLPMQPGDVERTFADVGDLTRDVSFRPETPIEVGVEKFIDWYRSYYSDFPTDGASLPPALAPGALQVSK